MAVRLRPSLSFVGEAGWAPRDDATRSDATLRAELLGRLPIRGRAIAALGAGWMQDYSRTPIATGRVMFGYDWPKTLVASNLRLEHPFGARAHEEKRDPIDVIMTLGVSHAATGMLRVGVESVAEDLEGFVESDEAEGGAKLMLGPSLWLAPPGSHWRFVVVAGPVLRLTTSSAGPTSGAPRDLTNAGYLVRTSVMLHW